MISNGVMERRKIRQDINDGYTTMFIREMNLKQGIDCLEIGAGLGSIAEFVSDIIGENGHIDVIDIKEENIREIEKRKKSNMSIYKLDIHDSFFDDKKYDFIHARFVFEHIPDAIDTLNNIIKNNLKVDGYIFIEDAVYNDISYTGSESFKKVIKSLANLTQKGNTDYSFGRNIKYIFEKNNLKDINATGITRSIYGDSEEATFWKKSILENKIKIKDEGILENDIKNAIKDLEDKNQLFSGPMIMSAYGKK